MTGAQLDYLLRQVLVAAGLGPRNPKGAPPSLTCAASWATPPWATTQGYVDSVARDRQAAAAANPALRHLRQGDR